MLQCTFAGVHPSVLGRALTIRLVPASAVSRSFITGFVCAGPAQWKPNRPGVLGLCLFESVASYGFGGSKSIKWYTCTTESVRESFPEIFGLVERRFCAFGDVLDLWLSFQFCILWEIPFNSHSITKKQNVNPIIREPSNPNIQKSTNPILWVVTWGATREPRSAQIKRFGFVEFGIFGFGNFGIFGSLDFGIWLAGWLSGVLTDWLAGCLAGGLPA